MEVQIVSYVLPKNIEDENWNDFSFSLYAISLWVTLVIYFERELGELRELVLESWTVDFVLF